MNRIFLLVCVGLQFLVSNVATLDILKSTCIDVEISPELIHAALIDGCYELQNSQNNSWDIPRLIKYNRQRKEFCYLINTLSLREQIAGRFIPYACFNRQCKFKSVLYSMGRETGAPTFKCETEYQ
ncbi:CSEP0196 putative effector protein [Blumeria hordei DH14]|uniref:CSEP0196 putative effector protein n=1 Tax=Blumeria graminis f. sp. hordei (strain DH14) TaxID=546991 RepID=N1JN37_BLUG1|nr:CSEP0196 putative effector protein [Blumeria hordei DH14]